MSEYLEKVKVDLEQFSKYEIKQFDNEVTNADALVKLDTSKDA